MNDNMSLGEPSPDLLAATSRVPCARCDAARANWARGGYHLSCRACEIRAVANRPIAARQAFYSRLVAEARAATACGVRGAAQSGQAA